MRNTKTDTKQNNRGFSLVELIVVISIMSILVGLVSVGAGTLSGKKAKVARDKLISSLDNVRTQTMGKESIDATLYYDSASSQYVLQYTYTNTTKKSGESSNSSDVTVNKAIGSSQCIIYYAVTGNSTGISTAQDCEDNLSANKVTGDQALEFSFNRSSGELTAYTVVTGDDGSSTRTQVDLDYIYVVQGSHDPYGIRFYRVTGKMTEV
jgi:prepilin-type N-terminal cleavage/methylation domain-containing protein